MYGVLLRKRTGKLSDFKVGAGERIQAREKEGFLRETPHPNGELELPVELSPQKVQLSTRRCS